MGVPARGALPGGPEGVDRHQDRGVTPLHLGESSLSRAEPPQEQCGASVPEPSTSPEWLALKSASRPTPQLFQALCLNSVDVKSIDWPGNGLLETRETVWRTEYTFDIALSKAALNSPWGHPPLSCNCNRTERQSPHDFRQIRRKFGPLGTINAEPTHEAVQHSAT